jgi:hypothetical protein
MSVAQKRSNASVAVGQSANLEIELSFGMDSVLADDWLRADDPAVCQESTIPDQWSLPLNGASPALFLCKVLWASPWSLWGLSVGVLGLLTGGGMQRSGRILEFWGGILPLFLKYFPFIAGSPVATFGHVVLGRCPRHLDACRPHQLIHVKQYEQWGPLFVPTYITCWIVLWFIGKRPYLDNPFEREAFDKTS